MTPYRHMQAVMAALLLLALTAAGCARMGQPDGGWYDDTPPKVVAASPHDRATGVKGRKVTINFDEYIKLEDATNKVVVSPTQLEMPEVKAEGKRIVVQLLDSLKHNTTYTIDFSDAISDNNEGNPMGNYTYSFATGDVIDTLEVAGNVLDASNLEPVKGILVGLYRNLADSVFATMPLERVARTDGSGRFVIKGVAPGTYRAYALNDMDGNFFYSQKSEMLAFDTLTFSPSCKPDIRQDTIWRDTLRIDNIIRTPYTHFYPDNIVLLAFTAEQTDRYFIKAERQDHRKIDFVFSGRSDSLPVIRGLNFDAEGAFVREASPGKDTLAYWLRDTLLANTDTLALEMTYMGTDTAGATVALTDTLEVVARHPYAKRAKALAEAYKDWKKEQERLRKKELPYDTVMPREPLQITLDCPSALDPDKNVFLETAVPPAAIDTAAFHLYYKEDTLWYRSRCVVEPVEGTVRRFVIKAEWKPGTEYSLEIDSAAMTGIYGAQSPKIKRGLKVRTLDEFSTLMVNVAGAGGTPVVVQLLNSSDAVVKQAPLTNSTAEFYYVNPSKYYIRAFADSNGNGRWDTGDYAEGLQPERVWYLPRAIECKAKWDVTTEWNLNAAPATRQKPGDITRQKPDKEKRLRNRNADRARELGIEYIPK